MWKVEFLTAITAKTLESVKSCPDWFKVFECVFIPPGDNTKPMCLICNETVTIAKSGYVKLQTLCSSGIDGTCVCLRQLSYFSSVEIWYVDHRDLDSSTPDLQCFHIEDFLLDRSCDFRFRVRRMRFLWVIFNFFGQYSLGKQLFHKGELNTVLQTYQSPFFLYISNRLSFRHPETGSNVTCWSDPVTPDADRTRVEEKQTPTPLRNRDRFSQTQKQLSHVTIRTELWMQMALTLE